MPGAWQMASATVTSLSVGGVAQTPGTCPSGSGLSGSCYTCVEGTDLDVGLTLELINGASSVRSDIGLWIAQDGSAQLANVTAGNCTFIVFPNGTQQALNQTDGDFCTDLGGGVQQSVNLTEPVKIKCGSVGGTNTTLFVSKQYCSSWTVPGADKVCPTSCTGKTITPFTYSPCEICTAPSSTSKCKCDVVQLNILIQRCQYNITCKNLTNSDVEGCNATDALSFLPPAKSYTDVFNITNSNCGGNATFYTNGWSFMGSFCNLTNPLKAVRIYTAKPPPNAPNQANFTCTESVIIKDTTAPTFTDPQARSEECPGCFNTTVENHFTTPTVYDRCAVNITSTPAAKTAGTGCSPKTGTWTKTYTARDACGNTDTTTATVNITDKMPPTFNGCPTGTSTTNICTQSVPTPPPVTGTDACEGAVTVTGPDCCFTGTGIKHNWTATDSCGNAAQNYTQNITFTPNCSP